VDTSPHNRGGELTSMLAILVSADLVDDGRS